MEGLHLPDKASEKGRHVHKFVSSTEYGDHIQNKSFLTRKRLKYLNLAYMTFNFENLRVALWGLHTN